MMDGRRPAGVMSGDPAAVAALAPIYRWLQESPDTAYRASMLPIRRTTAGDLQPAIPGALMDLMRGGVDLMAGPQTGVMSPEATQAMAGFAGSSVFSRPQSGVVSMFAGPKAKTAPLDKLAVAERMAAEGAEPRAIWSDTGWFQGADGKWRWEIDDSGFVPTTDAGPAATALPHAELTAAYPGLMSGTAVQRKKIHGFKAAYNPAKKEILLSPDDPDMRSSALHEMQHAVQEDEGFATGGNASTVFEDQINAITKEQAELSAAGAWDGFDEWRNSPAVRKLGLSHRENMNRYLKSNPEDEAFRRVAELADIQGRLETEGLQKYPKLAGEVEARAVQRRIDYTPAQRRAVFPPDDYDVPMAQQIVRERR